MNHPSPATTLPEAETTPKPPFVLPGIAALVLGASVISLFLFAWIADTISHQQTLSFDLAVRNWVHQHASPSFTTWMIGTSFLGERGLGIVAIAAIVMFLLLRWRRAVLWLLVSLLGATVLDSVLKVAFHRPRPAAFFVPLPDTYSFPSGHALVSCCFYGVLAGLVADRIRSPLFKVLVWAAATFLVFAIGFSRVYLGVHYPSDVIAGYLAAMVWVGSLVALDRLRIHRKRRF
jgi:undecaprenyl-diphosphatase